jgi:hypothetical protein
MAKSAEGYRDELLRYLRRERPKLGLFEKWDVAWETWILDGRSKNGDSMIMIKESSLTKASREYRKAYQRLLATGLLK